MSLVVNPYAYFTDTNGDALNGYLYIGEAGKNAENYPIAIYYDGDLTIPAPNPLTINAGYVYNSGTIAQIYASEDYSVVARKADGSLVFSKSETYGMINGAVATVEDLKGAIAPYNNYALNVLGNIDEGDGEGGLFYYDANSTATADDINIIQPTSGIGRWIRTVALYLPSTIAYTIETVDDFDSIPAGYTTAIVKDLDRGGIFIWEKSGTANGGTIFDGATGVWIRQYSDAVNVKWFGAYSDGTHATETTAAIQKAINVSSVLITAGTYLINSAISIPLAHNFIGNSSSDTFVYIDNTNFTAINGYAFGVNMNSSFTSWNVTYPSDSTTISGITFEHINTSSGATSTLKCFYIGSRAIIKECNINYFQQGIVKYGTYIDMFRVEKCNLFTNNTTTDYYLNCGDLGDGLFLSQLHFSGSKNSIYIQSSRGFIIENIINGSHKIYGADGSFTSFHCEGYDGIKNCLLIDSSRVSCKNMSFQLPDNGTASIVYIKATAYISTSEVYFENCYFGTDISNMQYDRYDIEIDERSTVSTNNVYHVGWKSGEAGSAYLGGVKIKDPSGNLYKFSNSISSGNKFNYWSGIFNSIKYVVPTENSTSYASNPTLSSKTTWNITSGTYYYKLQLLVQGFNIGKTSATSEFSISMTNGSSGLQFAIPQVTVQNFKNVTLRWYRGTSSEVYDYYVDIPITGGMDSNRTFYYDNGLFVNGYAWTSRVGGAVDSVISIPYFTISHLPNNTTQLTGIAAAAPTLGTWNLGDKIYNLAPSAGGYTGWICTTAGTPGTWKTFGAITE